MARRKLSPKEKYCASRPEPLQPDPSSQALKAAEKGRCPWFDKLTMRINSLKTLDLILSLSKDEAKLPGFFSSLLTSPLRRRNHMRLILIWFQINWMRSSCVLLALSPGLAEGH
jgi:hypothetical protein